MPRQAHRNRTQTVDGAKFTLRDVPRRQKDPPLFRTFGQTLAQAGGSQPLEKRSLHLRRASCPARGSRRNLEQCPRSPRTSRSARGGWRLWTFCAARPASLEPSTRPPTHLGTVPASTLFRYATRLEARKPKTPKTPRHSVPRRPASARGLTRDIEMRSCWWVGPGFKPPSFQESSTFGGWFETLTVR